MEMLNADGRWVSPEVEVPMITRGLSNIYGKKSVLNILKNAFNVNGIDELMKDPNLFRALSAFHKAEIQTEIANRSINESSDRIISINKGE